MALSEIEKLERRYAENPSGLTFAPLAEVHRKNGDVARALELLRPGLELHPDYAPASIVLGRCHLDLGDLPAAEAAFGHVLSLDGENVIALKALADIAERQHHFDEAERRLTTLLSVDRSNDEARAQLERIGSARRDAAAAPPPPAEALAEEVSPAPEVAAGSAPAAEEVEASPSEPVPAWMAAPEAAEPAPLPLEELEPALTSEERPEPPPEGLQVEETPVLEGTVEPLVGLVGRDLDQAQAGEPVFDVEQSEDIVLRSAGGSEFQVPDAALELSDRPPPPAFSPFGDEPVTGPGNLEEPPAFASSAEQVASGPVEAAAPERVESEPREAAPTEPPEPRPAEPIPAERYGSAHETSPDAHDVLPELTEGALEPDAGMPHAEAPVAAAWVPPETRWHEPETVPHEPAPEPVAEPEPELVVTESMAEVLRQQGHPVEALRVYRELEARGAGDPRLREVIAELEEEARGPAPEPVPRRVYTASETGGRSVGDFFRTMLAARPAAVPAAARAAAPAESSGAPTRPAAEALSLSSVFGEDTSPLPPAVPAPGSPPAGVSFDEFYGAPSTGAAQKARAPDPKSDDLDQFHAWLQNLKR